MGDVIWTHHWRTAHHHARLVGARNCRTRPWRTRSNDEEVVANGKEETLTNDVRHEVNKQKRYTARTCDLGTAVYERVERPFMFAKESKQVSLITPLFTWQRYCPGHFSQTTLVARRRAHTNKAWADPERLLAPLLGRMRLLLPANSHHRQTLIQTTDAHWWIQNASV